MKTRLNNLDWIRGLAVLWVVIVHISLNYGIIQFGVPREGCNIFDWLSFYMVPFFVVSGYFFSPRESFVKTRAQKLLVPYVFFSFWGIFIYEVNSLITQHSLSFFSLKNALPTAALFCNTPCWFFWSLFWICILYNFISKIKKNYVKNVIVAFCFFIALGLEGKDQVVGCGNIFLGIVYFHIGLLFRRFELDLKRKWVFIVALIVYGIISFFYPQQFSFVLDLLTKGNFVINFIFSIAAMIVLWNVAAFGKHDNRVGRFICFIGRDSLVLFAFHRPVLNWVVQPILKMVNPNMSYFLFLTCSLFLICSLFIVLNYIMRRFFPKMLGL